MLRTSFVLAGMFVSALGLSSAGVAQPTKGGDASAANGPSLAETFDFINRKLPGLRSFSTGNDGTHHYEKIDGLSLDRCTMSYTHHQIDQILTVAGIARRSGERPSNPNEKDIENDESTSHVSVAFADLDPAGGSVTHYRDDTFYLTILLTKVGNPSDDLMSFNDTKTGEPRQELLILLESGDIAERLNKAFMHATQLCIQNPASSPKDTF